MHRATMRRRWRHAVRRREAERADIRAYFKQTLERREIDLSRQPGVCELTGSLVIDRARGIGFCGLGERCDETGARAMHEAFRPSGNSAFDSYKSETLKRLEDEQQAFEAFLQRLRDAKDKSEFDAFMDDRARASRDAPVMTAPTETVRPGEY